MFTADASSEAKRGFEEAGGSLCFLRLVLALNTAHFYSVEVFAPNDFVLITALPPLSPAQTFPSDQHTGWARNHTIDVLLSTALSKSSYCSK